MLGWQVFAATFVMIVAMFGVVLSIRPNRLPNGRSVAEIRRRVLAEAAGLVPLPLVEAVDADLPSGASVLPHNAPEHPFELPEAHRTMQQHVDCTVAGCARKAAAYRVLVAAGRIKPR